MSISDSVRFNGQEPGSRRGKAAGSRALEMQSAQAIGAAYYFDSAAREYILADSAIEPVNRGSSILGFYRAVAKPRAYLLRPGELAVREESRYRGWQTPSRFARTKQSRDERGRVSRNGFNFCASRALSRMRSAVRQNGLYSVCRLLCRGQRSNASHLGNGAAITLRPTGST
jgi:hypothetical protein